MVKLLYFSLIVVFTGCSFPEKLSIIPSKNVKSLRINGYYLYTNSNGDTSFFFLNSNGVCLKGLSVVNFKTNKKVEFIAHQLYEEKTKKMITNWGAFQLLDSNKIIIEHWEAAEWPPITRLEGKILNDTTILIQKSSNKWGVKTGELYCHFVYYPNKPDSTNNFTSNPKYYKANIREYIK